MQHSNCYSNVENINHSITNLNTGAISFTNSPFLFILSKFSEFLPLPTNLILPNIPAVNYVIHSCSSLRTTPGSLYRSFAQEKSLYRSFAQEKKHCCSYYSYETVIDGNLKRQIKNRSWYS